MADEWPALGGDVRLRLLSRLRRRGLLLERQVQHFLDGRDEVDRDLGAEFRAESSFTFFSFCAGR